MVKWDLGAKAKGPGVILPGEGKAGGGVALGGNGRELLCCRCGQLLNIRSEKKRSGRK